MSEIEDRSEAIALLYRELKPARTNGQPHETGRRGR